MSEQPNTPLESQNTVFEQFGIPSSPSFKEKSKPANWHRRSKAPYYNMTYGRAMKAVADRMLLTKKDQRFDLACFPNISIGSLYARVNQGIRFLVEQLDTPNKTYACWKTIIVVKNEGDGIRIAFADGMRDIEFTARDVINKEDLSWKERVDDYLEGDEKAPLVIENLALTTEEALTLIASLKTLTNITFQVTKQSIRIIKLTS